MKNLSTKLAKTIAKISLKSAIKAGGMVSTLGCYQPKEPEALKNFKHN